MSDSNSVFIIVAILLVLVAGGTLVYGIGLWFSRDKERERAITGVRNYVSGKGQLLQFRVIDPQPYTISEIWHVTVEYQVSGELVTQMRFEVNSHGEVTFVSVA